MLKIENVSKTLNRLKILDNISFEVSDEIIAVCGSTGAGKTVLLKIIAGLVEFDAGKIILDHNETIGFIFQHSALFDSLSVKDNIRLPLQESTNFSEKAINRRVHEVAERLNLTSLFLTKKCSELSGGERKIVAIGRAIIGNPTYLLYDEPTTGLDPIAHNKICDIIRSLNKPGILVSHNMDTIKGIGIKIVYLLKTGKLHPWAKEYYE